MESVIKCVECGNDMDLTAEYPNDEKYYKCRECGRSVCKGAAATFERKSVNKTRNPEGFIISKDDFNKLFIARLEHCKGLVLKKEAEYSQGNVDRMIQFVEDAKMNGITPAQSAWNMFSKHVTSLRLAVKNEEVVTQKWIDDRITDMIIYPILLEAILSKTQLEG